MPGSTPVSEDWILPDWPAAPQVRAVCTTRHGGVSTGSYASMNPADHVGDDPGAVLVNRRRLQQRLQLPAPPRWLQQVHGTTVIDAGEAVAADEAPVADAAWCSRPGVVCAVLTADCLPVLLCDTAGRHVAALHAGWRGLAAGVIEQTIEALRQPGESLLAWFGPAIGPGAYQVGEEVREAFLRHDRQANAAFQPDTDGSWRADLYLLARQRLADCGVTAVYGGHECSFTDAQRFFSYRRDGVTGRMATLIWLQP
jgi:purine-nucleoside/S-methyl-5'-thioadenosine phosphorylase / adenosine deaminase